MFSIEPPCRVRTLFGASASAVLYVACQEPVGVSGLAFCCLVPWLLAVRNALTGAIAGSIFGFLVASGCGWWAVPSLARTGMGPGEALLVFGLAVLWTKGLPFALAGAWIGAFQRYPIPLRVMAVVVAVFGLEGLHSIPPWGIPWAFLGHSQWRTPGLAQLAAIGGVPVLSAVIALVNALLTESIRCAATRGRLLAPLGASAAALLALGVVGVPVVQAVQGAGTGGDPVDVLAIQTSTPPGERWVPEVQRTRLLASLRIAREEIRRSPFPPDLVVFPETLVTNPIEESSLLAADLAGFTGEIRTPLILGAVRPAPSQRADRYRNSALAVDSTGQVSGAVDKRVAIPLVESGDALTSLFAALLPSLRSQRKVTDAAPAQGLRAAGSEFAVVLCYEALFPGVVEARRGAGARAVLYLANDAWLFGDSMRRQGLAAAAFRAIEQRLPLVRVSDGGGTAAVDPYGRLIGEIEFEHPGGLPVRLAPAPVRDGRERLAVLGILLLGGTFGWLVGSTILERRRVMRMLRAAFVGSLLLVASATSSGAQGVVATLHLDGLSFVSFEGKQAYALPPGSTIRFRFGSRVLDTVPFTIQPADVSIEPIDVGDGATLRYGLASAASGSLTRTKDGQPIMRFAATISATLGGENGGGTKTYALEFTTEGTSARSADGRVTAEIQGMRLVEGARYVQLVGAVTNKSDAFPAPGTAVTAALSGTFDGLPSLR
jgi:apolipoprotein N-acyltransferase